MLYHAPVMTSSRFTERRTSISGGLENHPRLAQDRHLWMTGGYAYIKRTTNGSQSFACFALNRTPNRRGISHDKRAIHDRANAIVVIAGCLAGHGPGANAVSTCARTGQSSRARCPNANVPRADQESKRIPG